MTLLSIKRRRVDKEAPCEELLARRRPEISVCSLFSGCLGFRIDREIDKNVPEYGGVDSPQAHLCSSSGDLQLSNKPVS